MSRPQSEAEYLARHRPAVRGRHRPRAADAAARRPARRRRPRPRRPASPRAAVTTAAEAAAAAESGGGTCHLRLERERNRVRRAARRDGRRLQGGLRDVEVKINAVDHNTFQENINTYLQGNADDVFSWFAGLPDALLRRDRPDRRRQRHLAAGGHPRLVQGGLDRQRRQAVLLAAVATTPGPCSTGSRPSRRRATPSRRPSTRWSRSASRCRPTA